MTIYQHYREEEHLFVDQILSMKEQVERNYLYRVTDFLNPREQQIVKQLIGENNEEWQLKFFGGNEYTERKKAIIAPFYEDITKDDFEISLLEATYSEKFISLSHRDVMGAFLSLGIERNQLGDIYVGNGIIQIVTSEDIAPFVMSHLTSIKNANVQLHTGPLSRLLIEQPNWKTFERTVPSLRFDAMLKAIYNLSRKDASSLIKRKHARINHKTVEDAAYIVEAEDLISVRGKGRSKFIRENGLSRKGRIRVTVAILK